MAILPLLLFDMDGTLLDTRSDIATAANLARKELGLPPMTLNEVVAAVGDGVDLFVSRVTFPTSDSRFREAKSVFMAKYEAHSLGETKPYDGIPETLAELKSIGYSMGVVSNKPKILVDQLIDHFDWGGYFGVCLGGDSASHPKPSPEPLFLALELLGLPRSHPVVMIGDGQQDLLAAKNMGCASVWCSWGFNSAMPDGCESRRLDHPRGLMGLLKSIRA
jgi:phosphoglycolate phosphatase